MPVAIQAQIFWRQPMPLWLPERWPPLQATEETKGMEFEGKQCHYVPNTTQLCSFTPIKIILYVSG